MPKILTPIAVVATLVILTVLVYGHTLHYSFHFDDYYFITENLNIRDITDIKAVWQSLAKPSRFLGMLSFALNYHFHGAEVTGYHLVNIFIHVVNGLLVYWFCRMTMALGPRAVRRPEVAALFAAALFVVHPVNTQAVTYIAQRFAAMATLFYLAAFCLYIRGRQSSRTKPRVSWFTAAAACAVAGMFTKQIVLTLPVMILLYEFCFLRRGRRLQLRWWQVVVFAALFFLVPTLQSWDFSRLFDVAIASRSHEGDKLTWYTYMLTQFRVVPVYLRLMVFPVGQTLDYDFPASVSLWQHGTWAGAVLVAAVFGFGVRRLRRDPLTGFGICWFYITMGLESTFIPIYQVIFEHRCYLPSVGFVLAAAIVADRVFRCPRRQAAALAVIVAVMAWTAHQRNTVWESEATLWRDIMRKAPQKVRPYIHLGVAHLMKGEYDEALKILDAGIAIRQDNYRLFHNRGLVYEMQGHLKEAMWNYSKAIELNGKSAVSLTNRAGLFTQINRFDLAWNDYVAAIKADPDYGNAYLGRGNLLYRSKRYEEALKDFNRAVTLGVPISAEEMDKVRRLAQ